MTENEFLNFADKTLEKIMDFVEQNDPDSDCIREGHVLKMESGQGIQIVLNIQTPMQEIWLAGPLGGYHYRSDDGSTWLNTKTGNSLDADVRSAMKL